VQSARKVERLQLLGTEKTSELCLKERRRSDHQIFYQGKGQATQVKTVDKVRKGGKKERVKQFHWLR
jgi:mRNA-degrading endonuclease toxin of MazEF toxin-antitoxin module